MGTCCGACGRQLRNQTGLMQHTADKHPQLYEIKQWQKCLKSSQRPTVSTKPQHPLSVQTPRQKFCVLEQQSQTWMFETRFSESGTCKFKGKHAPYYKKYKPGSGLTSY